ncbi:hypothetical protein P9112_011003 [Eukaryota sp. TZLM1-RC]
MQTIDKKLQNYIVSAKLIPAPHHECQDRFLIEQMSDGTVLLAVIDGHGRHSFCTDYLHSHLVKKLFSHIQFSKDIDAMKRGIQKCFDQLDYEICSREETHKGGAVLTLAVLSHPVLFNDVLIANVGDCWASILRKDVVLHLTRDHNAAEPREQKRLTETILSVCPSFDTDWLFSKKAGKAVYFYQVLQPVRNFGNCYFKSTYHCKNSMIGKKEELCKLIDAGVDLINPVATFTLSKMEKDDVLILSSDGFERKAVEKAKIDFSKPLKKQYIHSRLDDATIITVRRSS